MQLPASDNAYSNARNSEEMDLKKHANCSFQDDDATEFTSMSSLTDSMTIASTSTRSRRGSILKTPSSSGKPKLNFPKRRTSRISFSSTANQIFTIDNNEEYYDELFYDQESLADFRYEALMWQTGMVDENGTPVSVIQSANETNDKYEHLDDLNGSLDFDELVLEELQTDGDLKDGDQDKDYSREAIREIRKSIDSTDLQWKSTADIFNNLADWDDEFDNDDDIESVAADDELNDDLDNPFTPFDADVPGALSSKEKFDKQRRKLSFHKDKELLDGHNAFNFEEKQNSFSLLKSSEDGSRDSNSERSERMLTGKSDTSSQRSQRSPVYELDSQRTQSTSLVYEVDDSERTQSTLVGDTNEHDSSHHRKKLEKRDSVRQSLQSLSDVFLSASQHGDSGTSLDQISSHSANGEGDKRSRLMAKMRGLRESLRSIQDMEDIDSDDDSEWGDEDGNEKAPLTTNVGIDTKNLKHSLIVKHLIYSPVPNQARGTIERLESVKEMTVPEL